MQSATASPPMISAKAEAMRLMVDASLRRWLPQGSLRSRFANALFWSFIGILVARSLGLVASVFTARFLGQVGFGEYGIITSTLSMFTVLGGLGLGLTATKHVAEFRGTSPAEAGTVAGFTLLLAFISSSLISLAFFVFAPFLAATTLNAPHLSSQLRLASIYLLLTGINGVQIGVLSGFEAFAAIARVNLIRGALNLPLTLVIVSLFGLSGAIATLSLLELVTVFINRILITRESHKQGIPICYRGNQMQFKLFWNFSLPSFLSSVFNGLSVWAVNALLVNRPNGYSEMGILSAAIQWQAVAIVIPSIFSTVGIAIQSDLFGKGDHKSFNKMVGYNLLLQTGGTAMVALLLAAVAPFIMQAYGKNFSAGIPVLILLATGWIIMTASSVLWDSMLSSNQIWRGFLFKLLGYIVLFATAWHFIHLGAKGVAIAYLSSYTCTVSLQISYFILRRKSQVQEA
jgi:O-antigen/teichoic acid export membrane protein